MKPRVLVTATNFSQTCAKARALLERQGFDVLENLHQRPMRTSELLEVVGEVDAVVAGVDAWNAEIFRHAPRLSMISRFGTGVDNISVVDASHFGIAVANCPGANADAVADFTIGLMLAVCRQIPLADRETRAGGWPRHVGRQLWQKTLGLVGLGRIGRAVAVRAGGFQMRVLAYDVIHDDEFARSHDIVYTTLDDLLIRSDFVSLHLPARPETIRLIDAQKLGRMRRTSFLINTARGSLIDEAALYDVLQSHRLAGAALDVYAAEPVPKETPLLRLENVVVTPHLGGETEEAIEAVSLQAVQNILDLWAGKVPATLLNPEVRETVQAKLRRLSEG
jgi:D-3-phosphoglycerate dehydrogenase / 2-oxoglutarate reductase